MVEEEYDPVTMDIQIKDKDHLACIEHLEILSGGERMLGTLFRAQGAGPHPTAIILHGFPGHEKNLDLAHTLRRGGMNALVFHYRGSWGSGGIFSFSNMLEDVKASIEHLRNEKDALSVDPSRIFLIGHSMGGWAAMMTALKDSGIYHLVSMAGFNLGIGSDVNLGGHTDQGSARATMERLSVPLRIRSVDSLMNEVIQNGREWNLIPHAEGLSRKSILLIWSKNDQLSIPSLHFHPLYESLLSAGPKDLSTQVIDSDHSFSDSRIELQRTVWNWIKSHS